MFVDGGEIPSRHELLSMVKKHSSLIGKTIVDDQDASDIEMDPKFWHEVFDLYFIRCKESRGRQDDDLVFFVKRLSRFEHHGSRDSTESNMPYFVRRWAPKLDNLVCEISSDIDWRRSFYLNLIAHNSFSVTVAICSHQVLQNYQPGKTAQLSPIYKVVKTVYASPNRMNFHLDSTKEAETTPAYPDVCFAIDDFDSTFDAVVLTEKDHCYCVVLNAHDGGAFPSKIEQQHSTDSSSSIIETQPSRTKETKLTIFSGFVSYQMVRDAYHAGQTGLWSLLSGNHSPHRPDRLYMMGPGGRGEVEVAVSRVADQSQQDTGPFSPIISKKGFGIGLVFRKASSVASVVAKQSYSSAASSSNSDNDMIPLNCCLMSITLPWEHIAYDLLFKGDPSVNM